MRLILASKSPRRREILTMLGVPFETMTQNTDETLPAGTAPADAVRQLSARKARAVADALNDPDAIVIGADTVVYCGGEILGKPRDDADAARMLRLLSGTTHEVDTGLSLIGGGKTVTDSARTLVTFRSLTDTEIARYVACGEPRDKAGAYAVQGRGCLFVEQLAGDFYNVIGLPVSLLQQMLRDAFSVTLTEELND